MALDHCIQFALSNAVHNQHSHALSRNYASEKKKRPEPMKIGALHQVDMERVVSPVRPSLNDCIYLQRLPLPPLASPSLPGPVAPRLVNSYPDEANSTRAHYNQQLFGAPNWPNSGNKLYPLRKGISLLKCYFQNESVLCF